MKIEIQHTKFMECSKSSSKSEAHSNKCYFKILLQGQGQEGSEGDAESCLPCLDCLWVLGEASGKQAGRRGPRDQQVLSRRE